MPRAGAQDGDLGFAADLASGSLADGVAGGVNAARFFLARAIFR